MDPLNFEIGVVLIGSHNHFNYISHIDAQMSIPNPMLPENGTYMVKTDGYYFDYFVKHNGYNQLIPYNRQTLGDGSYPIFGTIIITPSNVSHRSINYYRDRMLKLSGKTGSPSFLIHDGGIYAFSK